MTSQIMVLLVEDEPLILLAVEEVLGGGGYSVLTASNGDDALAILEDWHDRLPGLITDIRLGNGPNGWDIAQRGRELNPLISVVYMTGDSAAEWPAYGVPKSVLLQKPFADAQLLTAISTLLNDASSNSGPAPEPS